MILSEARGLSKVIDRLWPGRLTLRNGHS